MNRARRVTLLILAVLVALFAATWLTSPSQPVVNADSLSPPADVFAAGLKRPETRTLPVDPHDPRCAGFGGGGFPIDCPTKEIETSYKVVDVGDLKQRELVAFGSAAATVLLIGLAFGAGRRTRGP